MRIAYLTYLAYIILWEGLILGGTGYAVFWLGHSGWWLLAAAVISSLAYSPLKWIHGGDSAERDSQPPAPPTDQP